MALVMGMFHGRHAPDEQLDDWGFDGPVFRIEGFNVTYMVDVRVRFASDEDFETAKRLTGWGEWDWRELRMSFDDDLVVARDEDGKPAYYGDWWIGPEAVDNMDEVAMWRNRAKAQKHPNSLLAV